MRDGSLERHEQAGLHHRQAHRYPGRGKALCKRAESVEGLVKEVHLAASYGELSEFLQQRVELVLRFFLALGEPVDAPMEETSPRTTSLEEPAPSVMDAESNTASIFGMGRG